MNSKKKNKIKKTTLQKVKDTNDAVVGQGMILRKGIPGGNSGDAHIQKTNSQSETTSFLRILSMQAPGQNEMSVPFKIFHKPQVF